MSIRKKLPKCGICKKEASSIVKLKYEDRTRWKTSNFCTEHFLQMCELALGMKAMQLFEIFEERKRAKEA